MRVIMFTHEGDVATVLPSASFLDSHVECRPPTPAFYSAIDDADVVMVDARGDLMRARALCQLLSGPMDCPPIILVLEEAPPSSSPTGAPPTSSWPVRRRPSSPRA